MVIAVPALPLVAGVLHGTSAARKETHLRSGVWFAIGVLASGLAHLPIAYSAPGAASGVLFGASRALSSASSQLVGSSVAAAAVSVCAILAAFGVGLALLDEAV